ncbi:winged helix-turn-helix domain-containing protein [Methanobrevibacter sp. DSM 116169]|uniref:winged helix-turn-helix domain-containing protein n=1 Tax=Methanobrevibacter sp. DSM 116169 TaxID=3242727 RepID=UPI0038FC3DAD
MDLTNVRLDKEDKEVLASVLLSKRLPQVLLTLAEQGKSPTQIAKELDKQPTHIIKYCKLLMNKNLVQIEKNESKNTAIYYLTEKGQSFIPIIQLIY